MNILDPLKQTFDELRSFFWRERKYLYLFAAVFSFYAGMFLMHQLGGHEFQARPEQNVHRALSHVSPTAEGVEERLAEDPFLSWSFRLFVAAFIAVCGYGTVVGVASLKRWYVRKEAPLGRYDIHLDILWGTEELIKVILQFLAFGILLNLSLVLLRALFFRNHPTHLMIVTQTLVIDFVVLWFIASSVRQKGSRWRDITGFTFSEIPYKEIWIGFRTYCVILPVFLLLVGFLIYISNLFKYEPPPHPVVEVFLEGGSVPPWVMGYLLVLACVVGPVVEEVFFRGFFYPALRKTWGIGGAMAITASLFALVHDNMFAFIPIFFLGVVLCYLYERRNNLIACISLHMVHNTAFILYFLLAKNLLIGEGSV